METIKNKAVQVLKSSEGLLKSEQQEKEISLYGQGKVTARCLALNIVKLKQSFPKLPDGWYIIFEEMLDEEGFTDERLNDAIKNLIKTCIYPEPTIANVLGYDKKQKLYTYDDILETTKDYSVQQRGIFWNSLKKHKKHWIKEN